MEEGLILNTSSKDHDQWVTRDVGAYPPAFRLDDGTPIFEVWFWHDTLRRWFVMSNYSDPRMTAQGVVYFRPGQHKQALGGAARALGIALCEECGERQYQSHGGFVCPRGHV